MGMWKDRDLVMWQTRLLSQRSNSGFVIPEILVSMGLLAIVIAALSNLMVLSMQSNTNTRTYEIMTAETQDRIDTLRNSSFSSILDKYATSYTSITDGQVVTETATSTASRSTTTITYTAIRSSNEAPPEAVKVKVSSVQRRGKQSSYTYEFETVISTAH